MKRAAAIAALISMVFAAPASAGTAEGTAAYERGDFAAAHREYMPAARAGDARAQFSLGLLYLRGLGVERDDIVAMQWLRRAAGQGDGDARLLLGELHMQDAPALRDLVKSHVWLSLALSKLRGPKRAAALDLRGRVAARMSGEQLDRAKKMVREWQALER